jgi:VanZ family protein
MKINQFYLLVFIFVAVSVLYALFRQEPVPIVFHQSDKVGHAMAFCALSFSLLLLLGQSNWKIQLVALISVLFFAVASEYIQGSELLPKRSLSLGDIYADIAGGILGFVLVKLRLFAISLRKAS